MRKQISAKSIVLLNIQGYCDNEEPLNVECNISEAKIFHAQNNSLWIGSSSYLWRCIV